jgi:hypothetical protein
MQYLIGKHWRDIFDVVIVQARKPKFFTDKNRPFRIYDLNHQNHVWDKVRKLEKGQVYTEVRYSTLLESMQYACMFEYYFVCFPSGYRQSTSRYDRMEGRIGALFWRSSLH